MKHIFDQLTAVRRSRESRRERELLALRRAYVQADADRQREERRLAQWRVRADQDEADIYASLLGGVVAPRTVDRAMQGVERLRQRTREHEREFRAAQSACDDRLAALRTGQQALAAATVARQKCEEAAGRHGMAMRAVEERRADDELDELGLAAGAGGVL